MTAQAGLEFGTLSADDIAGLLPHRFPLLLLDRVISLEPGVQGEAIKNISVSDPVLAGHFPGRMIYPGVLLVECVAQLAAVVYGTGALASATGPYQAAYPADAVSRAGHPATDQYPADAVSRAGHPATDPHPADAAGRVGYLAEISRVKFFRPTRPGDQLLIQARTATRIGALISVIGQVSIGRDVVMTARLGVTERTES